MEPFFVDVDEEQPATSNVPSPGDDARDAGTGDGLWADEGNFPGGDESHDGDDGTLRGQRPGDSVSVEQFEFPGDDEADIEGGDDDESQGERDGSDRDEGAAGADAQGRFAGDGEEVASDDQSAAPATTATSRLPGTTSSMAKAKATTATAANH